MDIVKYEKEHIVPVVIVVLKYIVEGLIIHDFQIALEGPYKCLKDLITNDEVDQATCDLLNILDGQVFRKCGRLIQAANGCMDTLVNINALDVDVVLSDLYVDDKAEDIYLRMISYDNAAASPEEAYNSMSDHLESINNILYTLAILVCDEEIDFDELEEEALIVMERDLDRYIPNTQDDFTIKQIKKLVFRLLDYQSFIYNKVDKMGY